MSQKFSPKLIISGAPASGKGTQCEYIKKEYNIIHLSYRHSLQFHGYFIES